MTSPKKYVAISIDDDSLITQSIKRVLPEYWDYYEFNSSHLGSFPTPTVCFIDIHLSSDFSKCEGLALIKKINSIYPRAEIVAISGDSSRDIMEKSLEAGASRYMLKPLSPNELKLIIKKIENLNLMREASLGSKHFQSPWIGKSKESERIRTQIANLAGESGPILIEGESGTGKEVVASLLMAQNNSTPKVIVNVASIPKSLFESELFGHLKGSFTGAIQNKIGMAEAANGGDLFLDEIEALPLNLQPKILRFLESGEIRRVGSSEPTKINCRLIAATNASLENMTLKNEFREDLLWRLNGFKIKLSPLRERTEDIPELFNYFLTQITATQKKELDIEALELLCNYSWPGNVRELKRVTQRLILESPLPIIRKKDVEKIFVNTPKTIENKKVDLTKGIPQLLNEYEASLVKEALKQSEDVDSIAKMLKISRSSLYKKVKDYGLEFKGL